MKYYLYRFSFFLISFFFISSRFLWAAAPVRPARRKSSSYDNIPHQEYCESRGNDTVISITDPVLGSYNIQTSLTSVGSYASFLNAVALEKDPHHLYKPAMTKLITYDASALHYAPVKGLENAPMTFVALDDAARFCNWEEHGEPTREAVLNYTFTHTSELTEEGSYTFINDEKGESLVPNSSATYHLPTSEELSLAARQQNIFSLRASEWILIPEQNNDIAGIAFQDENGNLEFDADVDPLAQNETLAQIFHTSHSEAKEKADETRRRQDFDQGCMSTYRSDQNSTTTQYSSALAKLQTERHEISGLGFRLASHEITTDQGVSTSRKTTLALQKPVKKNDTENISPTEKFKKKQTLIIAEVGGGLAYTANVYVLDVLLAVIAPPVGALVTPILMAIKIIGLAYCAYGWFTT